MSAYKPVSGTSAVMYAPAAIIELQPLFAGYQPVQSQWENELPSQVWGIFQHSKTFTIRQQVKLLPKACCACPPCVKQENTYSVYAGLSKNAEAEFLRIDEVSDDWNRCCCAPNHPLRLEARQYIPMPGEGGLKSDADWLKADVVRDWKGFKNGREKQKFLQNFYKEQPVMMSMVREDGQRCCLKCPCKCYGCFVCQSCCEDGMHIYAGEVTDPAKAEKGRPVLNSDGSVSTDKLIGHVHQPCGAGGFTPTLHLKDSSDLNESPFGKVEGPLCFGGWSECCFDFKFFTSRFASAKKTGDVALITKKKPQSIAGAAVELFTESDVYTIEFQDESLTASQKATVLTAQLLADYIYFDGNTEKCKSDENAIYCYFFYCSVYGLLVPCEICIPTKFG